ncbi:hypothetical protein CCP1ISM_4790001 [Azospirillaceae bacterium]
MLADPEGDCLFIAEDGSIRAGETLGRARPVGDDHRRWLMGDGDNHDRINPGAGAPAPILCEERS